MLGTRTNSEKTPKRSQSCSGFVQEYFHYLRASQIQSVFRLKDLKKKKKLKKLFASVNICCFMSLLLRQLRHSLQAKSCRSCASLSWHSSCSGRADLNQLWPRVGQELHKMSNKNSITRFLYMCVSLCSNCFSHLLSHSVIKLKQRSCSPPFTGIFQKSVSQRTC